MSLRQTTASSGLARREQPASKRVAGKSAHVICRKLDELDIRLNTMSFLSHERLDLHTNTGKERAFGGGGDQ